MTAAATVREHGILMTGEMVRATLERRKRMTRRVITNHNSVGNAKPSQCDLTKAWVDPGGTLWGPGPYLKAPVVRTRRGELVDESGVNVAAQEIVERIYPRYAVGDRLWVRETWALVPASAGCELWHPIDGYSGARFRATWDKAHASGWKPSIHMPRWASRLTLEITRIRVERVQDISEEDAIAEGCFDEKAHDGSLPSEIFRALWDSLNTERGYPWSANNWVWVYDFVEVK